MPVGCLSGESNSTLPRGGGGGARSLTASPAATGATAADNLEVVVTSSVLNAADQFAFMQQTLLLQIFRIGKSQQHHTVLSTGINTMYLLTAAM